MQAHAGDREVEDEHQVRAPPPPTPVPHLQLHPLFSAIAMDPTRRERAFIPAVYQQRPASCLSDGWMLLSQVAEVKKKGGGRKGRAEWDGLGEIWA